MQRRERDAMFQTYDLNSDEQPLDPVGHVKIGFLCSLLFIFFLDSFLVSFWAWHLGTEHRIGVMRFYNFWQHKHGTG